MIFLEKLLNQFLAFDPASKDRAKILRGKKIKIELIGVNSCFVIIFNEKHISINKSMHEESDLTIRATPLNLLQLKLSRDRRQLFRERIVIEGDMSLAQKLTDFFDGIEIDWEEHFSKIIGDMPAYHAGRFVRRMKEAGRTLQERIIKQFNEYLHEEIQFFPPREALNDFFHDIDAFCMSVDRLTARIKFLGERA